MNVRHLLTAMILSSLLMGCQIEVAPLDAGSSSSETGQTDSNTNTGTNNGNNGGAQPVAQTVTLYWSAPSQRLNGDYLSDTDIGGYEIRYKQATEASYQNILIDDASIDQYSIIDLPNADTYTFEVAVFDSDGVYSEFVVALAN